MSFIGMEPDAIRQVARALTHQAEALEDVMSVVQRQITRAEECWNGPDAAAFVDEWHGLHKAHLQIAIHRLHEMISTAQDQAAQQERTSSA